MRLLVALVALTTAWATEARAAPLRVAVAEIDGPRGEATREALMRALRARGEEVLAEDEVDAAAARFGRRIVRLMYRLDLDVFIDGNAAAGETDLRMVRRGAARPVRLRSRARRPEERIGSLLARYDAARPKPARRRARAEEGDEERTGEAEPERAAPSARDALASGEGRPARGRGSAPTETRAEAGRSRARRIPRDLGEFPRVIEGGITLGLVSRKLRYRDDLFDRAGGYSLGAAPALGFHARAHPFTSLRIAGLEDVGVALRGEQDFIESSSREGVTFRTYGARWDLDLLYRFPLGRVQATARVGYHRRVFSIDSAIARPGADNLPGVPNVRYEGLRLGTEGRAHVFGGLFADLRIAYVAILGAGAVHSDLWFPNGKAGAFEIGGDLVYRLTSFMDARLGVQFERVGHDLDPDPGDRVIAGGAVDRFTVFWIGVGFFR